jgi:hypothetical protein
MYQCYDIFALGPSVFVFSYSKSESANNVYMVMPPFTGIMPYRIKPIASSYKSLFLGLRGTQARSEWRLGVKGGIDPVSRVSTPSSTSVTASNVPHVLIFWIISSFKVDCVMGLT